MPLHRLYPIFIVLATAFTGYVLIENLSGFLSRSEILPIRQVRVLGLKNYPATELIKRLGIQSGDSLLFLRESKMKEAIASLPRLQIVTVERALPETLVLVMKENEGTLIAACGADRYEIDDRGALVASNEDILNADQLVAHFPDGTKWDDLKTNNNLTSLLSSFRGLPDKERDMLQIISEVDIAEEIALYPRQTRVSLQLGSAVTTDKLRKARYALIYADEKKMNPKRIDLRFDPVKYVM